MPPRITAPFLACSGCSAMFLMRTSLTPTAPRWSKSDTVCEIEPRERTVFNGGRSARSRESPVRARRAADTQATGLRSR
jgi:hypothetical protein